MRYLVPLWADWELAAQVIDAQVVHGVGTPAVRRLLEVARGRAVVLQHRPVVPAQPVQRLSRPLERTTHMDPTTVHFTSIVKVE